MTATLTQWLRTQPAGTAGQVLLAMTENLMAGTDPTLAALRDEAGKLAVDMLLVGGIAIIAHGYERTTKDRDLLLRRTDAQTLAERMEGSSDWQRVESSEFAFIYKPTRVPVDFLACGDLIQLGRPYVFPDLPDLETAGAIEGIPFVGLHDLLYLKLLAGRMRDLADVMELCKRHLPDIDPARVLQRIDDTADRDLHDKFHELLRQVPVELENERRLREQRK